MFVRFRQTNSTVQASLLAGRRIDGGVRHEQIVSFGSIKLPMTIDGRETFWRKLHESLARLGNRIAEVEQAKSMASIHARIPMVTPDERREHEIALAEREQHVWNGMHELLAERAAGMDGVASFATESATADRQGAADASTRAVDAADRRDRLRRGEDAPRGSEIDFEKIVRQAGWTSADIRHAVVLNELHKLSPEAVRSLSDISIKAGEHAHRAAARRMLRKLQRG